MEPPKKGMTDTTFKPSWVDRLTQWIEALPGPSWLAYLILFFLLGFAAHLGFWVSGFQPRGSYDVKIFLNQLWAIEILFFHQVLNRDAKHALKDFRPLLDATDAEFSEIQHEFTNLPARSAIYLTLISIPVGIYFAYLNEVPFSGEVAPVLVLAGILNSSLTIIFCYRIIRQLRMVSRLYEKSSIIDLYSLDPVYALSSHTAKTGLIFLFIIYSNVLITVEALQISAGFYLAIFLTFLSSAAFIVPLMGINHRLVEEKKKILQDIHQRIKMAFHNVERSFDEDSLDEISTLKTAISALESQKAYIEKIPTWPWRPSTLRGFLTAVLLPLGIWALQQVLTRLFNL
jgi:hypothetical protein